MGHDSTSDTAHVARWLEMLRAGGEPSLDEFCRDLSPEDQARVHAACSAAQSAFDLLRQITDGDQPDLPAGSRLGEFELMEPIGKGGMGVVYRARQSSLERDVAIKVLRVGTQPTPHQLARFKTEALATARIADPRIVKVHDVGEAMGQCYLVMELVEGHSLHEELERLRDSAATTTLPRPSKASGCRALSGFFADIAEALHHVHEQGVLHRDIQPKNILLDRDGRPRVIDFGLARIVDLPGQTNSGEVVGTPCYMSPEQVRAERIEIDRRTDVYSLAVVLYETLIGERAFTGSTTEQVLARIIRVDPSPADQRNHAVPRDLAIVCQKAMHKDLAQRYATAGEFAEELQRVARSEPIATRPDPAWRAVWRRIVARREIAIVGAMAVAATTLMTIVLAGSSPQATIIVDADVHTNASVVCQRLDPLSSQPVSTESLGAAPLTCSLPLGQYRLWLVRGQAFAELQLSLVTEDHRYRIGAVVLTTVEEVRAGMAQIGGATFRYGNDHDRFFGHAEQQATVGDYLIDEAEVSNGQFRAYVIATGNKAPSLWPDDWRDHWNPMWDELPVAGVDYFMASAYAAWAGKRLPTSRERMYAAMGPDDRRLPWRVDYDRQEALALTTMGRVESDDGDWASRWATYLRAVVPVRSMPLARSSFGLFHTLGNVSEWTETVLCKLVDGVVRPVITERMVADPPWHLVDDQFLTARHVGSSWDEANLETLGFRCAKSLQPPVPE